MPIKLYCIKTVDSATDSVPFVEKRDCNTSEEMKSFSLCAMLIVCATILELNASPTEKMVEVMRLKRL